MSRDFLRLGLALIMAMGTAGDGTAKEKKYNRLGLEKSPYLIQHAGNPIWWYAWGDEALAAAKRENKPVFLSVGYSTCYWCHFMEKDSFEKQDVADLLNEHFIAIKVDREERPDVDNIYMTALVTMTGQGGWPMSMFLTPDGRPFFGASTIPHESFMSVLQQVATLWKSDEAKIRKSGDDIAAMLRQHLNPEVRKRDVGDTDLGRYYQEMKFQFDETHAGFGGGNKFPRPHLLSALLRIHRRSGEADALTMAARTLKAMARGGIHDLLAGGFHRYSVDAQWDIPHFEKMLYDNAGLAIAYLEAFQVTGDEEFAKVARRTLDWVLAEMTHPDGGFYSAQDAGDFGKEGEFYAWTHEELTRALTPEEFAHVEKLFQISKHGNFEDNRNVFHVPDETPLPDEHDKLYKAAHDKLRAVRAKRERPRLDDKVMTDWNGLTIAAMARGYQVLGDDTYLRAAQKSAAFIRGRLVDKKGNLLHRWRDGDAAKRALLDDYAFLIHGLIELYQSDFDSKWMEWALELQSTQDRLLWDESGGAYFFDDAQDATLIVRSKDFEDMALPSGNSISALNLVRLSDFTYSDTYRTRARETIRAAAGLIAQAPGACPQMLIALDYASDRSKEIAIAGGRDDARTLKLLQTIRTSFLPNKVVALADGRTPSQKIPLLEGKVPQRGVPTAYVCERGTCKLPTTDAAELGRQVSELKKIE